MENTRYCSKCINFNSDKDTCSAFPNGIPIDILSGRIKHVRRFPEQVGYDIFEDRIEALKAIGIDTSLEEMYDDIEYED